MKIVTGANGLVGSYLLAELLTRGHRVRALKRKNSETKWTEFLLKDRFGPESEQILRRLEWADWDISDLFSLTDQLDGVDELYHCAAMVSFQRSDRESLVEINAIGTRNVVDALLTADHDIALCHISSTAAVGRQGNTPTHEDMDFQWDSDHSFYGLTKHLAEMEVERGRQEGLNAAILNPSVIIGFTDLKRGSGQIIGQALGGIPFVSSGSNGVVFAGDVSRAAAELMERKQFAGRFLCVGGHDSFAKQRRLLHLAFNKRPSVYVAPDWLIRLVGNFCGLLNRLGLTLPLTPEIARSAISNNRFDTSRIRNELNFEFTKPEEAYDRSVQCFQRFLQTEKSR